jgi:hypothetical protein
VFVLKYHSLSLVMDTAGTSETFVHIYQNTRRHILEDSSYETEEGSQQSYSLICLSWVIIQKFILYYSELYFFD